MTASKRIVVVAAGLSVPSTTRSLADRLADGATEALHARGVEVEIEIVELRALAHALADNLLTGFPSGDLAAAIERVRRADGLIVVTPVFAASYSGLFKTFFDVLENGALDGKPVLIAATAGTARHSLVLDHALRPLFAYLHAVVVPTGVFAASEDFGSAGDRAAGESALDKRIARAAAELALAVGGAGGGAGGAAAGVSAAAPARRLVEDELAAPTPFEALLRRASDPTA
ncbi:NADPH-dependent FMN reductase [Nocardioides sp. GY 10113]|uniref:CE1759 family FMN reductase n=1 Tax=Nocardioides sp. GY 10113 TaxID=2569761 RepID=UPI0010A755E4|nr:CE1759 family FMN reductase [Nocardioides sp. GY 10113]TIC87765.1 NADPH-dependent FMN reductase [Nocardioides sp. GY 10113]